MNHETNPPGLLVALNWNIAVTHAGSEVAAEQVPALIQNICQALAGLNPLTRVAARPSEPAVAIPSSVDPDSLTCLECGRKMPTLKRHLSAKHSLSPHEYRVRWNLAPDYPMVARNYSEVQRQSAYRNGLGRKPGRKYG